jgi:hypothetical protein
MPISKIHFVAIENETAFIHGKKNTLCGQPYENVGDYTSMNEFITCEKCKSKANSAQPELQLFHHAKY